MCVCLSPPYFLRLDSPASQQPAPVSSPDTACLTPQNCPLALSVSQCVQVCVNGCVSSPLHDTQALQGHPTNKVFLLFLFLGRVGDRLMGPAFLDQIRRPIRRLRVFPFGKLSARGWKCHARTHDTREHRLGNVLKRTSVLQVASNLEIPLLDIR